MSNSLLLTGFLVVLAASTSACSKNSESISNTPPHIKTRAIVGAIETGGSRSFALTLDPNTYLVAFGSKVQKIHAGNAVKADNIEKLDGGVIDLWQDRLGPQALIQIDKDTFRIVNLNNKSDAFEFKWNNPTMPIRPAHDNDVTYLLSGGTEPKLIAVSVKEHRVSEIILGSETCQDNKKPAYQSVTSIAVRGGEAAVIYYLNGCATNFDQTSVIRRMSLKNPSQFQRFHTEINNGNEPVPTTIDSHGRIWIAGAPDGKHAQLVGWTAQNEILRTSLSSPGSDAWETVFDIKESGGTIYVSGRDAINTKGYLALATLAQVEVSPAGAVLKRRMTYHHMSPADEGNQQAEAKTILSIGPNSAVTVGFVTENGKDLASLIEFRWKLELQ